MDGCLIQRKRISFCSRVFSAQTGLVFPFVFFVRNIYIQRLCVLVVFKLIAQIGIIGKFAIAALVIVEGIAVVIDKAELAAEG